MKQYNTLAQRIGAAFLDSVLFLLLSYIFTLIFNASINIYGFVLAAYHIICHAEFGQTLGKKLTNIKVVAVKTGISFLITSQHCGKAYGLLLL